MNNPKMKWIEIGYSIFALNGPNNIKIATMAKLISTNKSSFYHYFANNEVFISELTHLHIQNSLCMAEKLKNALDLNDLIVILLFHKDDLLFNRQLRVNRKNEEYRECFIKTNEFVGEAILSIWKKILDLDHNSYLARLVLKLSVENFFLQITEDNLTHYWLDEYFNNLKDTVKAFKSNRL